jgi:hypothetical protein
METFQPFNRYVQFNRFAPFKPSAEVTAVRAMVHVSRLTQGETSGDGK